MQLYQLYATAKEMQIKERKLIIMVLIHLKIIQFKLRAILTTCAKCNSDQAVENFSEAENFGQTCMKFALCMATSNTIDKWNSRNVGLSDCRTVGQSDSRTVGQSDSRTVGQSDSRTVGQSDRRTE